MATPSIILLVACTGGTSPPPPTASDIASPAQESKIEVTVSRPGFMVGAFGSVGVQNRAEESIWRIDPDGGVAARIPEASTSAAPGRYFLSSAGLAAGFGSIWSLTDDALIRIDPSSDRVVETLPIDFPYAVAVGEGAVWVVCCRGHIRLMRVDPSTMRAEVFAKLPTTASAMGVGGGYIWWGRFSEAGGLYRIDARSGEVADLQVGYNDRFIVPTPESIWLVDDGTARRIDLQGSAIDPRSKRKTKLSIGASYSNGTVWINDGAAVGFDAASGTMTARLPAFAPVRSWWSGGIAQLDDQVWVADPEGDRVFGLAIG